MSVPEIGKWYHHPPSNTLGQCSSWEADPKVPGVYWLTFKESGNLAKYRFGALVPLQGQPQQVKFNVTTTGPDMPMVALDWFIKLRADMIDVGLIDEFDSWDEIAIILRTSLFMNEKIDETVNKHKQEPELLVDEDVFLQWQANDTVTQTTEIICAKCGCHNRVSSNKNAECIQVRKTTDTGIHTIYYACSHCNQTYQLAWTRRK